MEVKKENFAQKFVKLVTRNPIVFLLLIAAVVVGCIKDNFFLISEPDLMDFSTGYRFLINL